MNMQNKQNKMNKWLALLSIFILSACGGGSDSSSTVPTPEPEPEPTQITIYAENTTDYISAGVSGTIDLSSHIKTSDGSAVYIKSVKALNNVRECSDFKVNTLSFEVKVNDITSCNYEYTVSNSANTVSATKLSRVATQGARNSTGLELPIISKVTQINATVITDLATELGSAWSAGKSLDENSIVLLGNGTATPETNNRIKFDNITTPGYATILYSVIDETTGDTYLGSIVISISTDIYNRAPKAYDFDANNGDEIAVDTAIDINVATATTGNISDPDADTLTLVDVIAINTTIEITGPTSFTFSTKNVGTSYITYIISDGKGGYATAQIKINVPFPPNATQTWEDITIPNTKNGDKPITFTAPISKKLADYYNISYSGSTTEDGTKGPEKVGIVLMNAEQATDYCTTRNGRLPTLSELDMLYNNRGRSLWESDKWPTSNVFWSADGQIQYNTLYALKARSLFDAAEPEILLRLNGNAYTTCVLLKPDNSVPDFTLSKLEDVSNDEGYRYTTTLKDPYGNAAKYLPITLSTEDKLGRFLDSNNAEQETAVQFTDADGVLTFDYISPDLKDEIIEARYLPNIARNIIFKTAEIKEEEIDTSNLNSWNRLAMDGYSLGGIFNETALTLFHNNGTKQSANVYAAKSFTGSDFSMYWFVYVQDRSNGMMLYTFNIQQVSDTPQLSWNTYNLYPGTPKSNKAIAFSIDVQNSGVLKVYYGTTGDYSYYAPNTIVKQNAYVHHWFDKRGDELHYYVSTTPNSTTPPVKPSVPFHTFPFNWAGIDPTQPYWIGFGNFNYYQPRNGLVHDIKFGAK